jgi:tetratricopeptide (TPR) repeat protein
MSRWLLALLLLVPALSADDLKKTRPPAQQSAEEEVPPEEDGAIATKQYSFNPLQSKKEIAVGNQYFKKGAYLAAAGRFREAIHWDASNGEAWLRLAEAEERRKDMQAARQAYEKYLAVSPDAKNAADIRRKLEKLK